ncbi:hypothetical protein N7509_001517 [Penicillium cosmopolitanum]|uniref:N,O-diacetylmuramidase n=1 Tax=Penicillium cosmopolitanum TaxID=1131564 RepID=A0A9W9W788_9EURO|nr:uncharacterized protein N7509_001517 [Penicillium cosmopolitanum]KAJ5407634.1 hypothetical protein N7509_001517 [Penicillium cosmopolitanum]
MTSTVKAAALSLLLAAAANAGPLEARASGVQGFDISGYQGDVDFAGAYGAGARFVMIKVSLAALKPPLSSSEQPHINPLTRPLRAPATLISPSPATTRGATSAGLIRGGYHFAQPASSSGASQAEYFLAHGGGWSNDGKTLPGMLDLEYNPSGSTCYGLSASDMAAWVKDFGETYNSKTGRYPMIYTTADWWKTCTGNNGDFGADYPLVLAQYASSISTLPNGWSTQSFWQNTDSYKYGGDSDLWNGSEDNLKKFAKGS